MLHNEDQGISFGTWGCATARLMYHDIMPLALCGVDISGQVADYGGANGLLKEWIPHSISIDYDESKKPDVVADILKHKGVYDLIVMRYILHYLTDEQVVSLFKHTASFHRGNLLLIQFVNEDLFLKRKNSIGETKYFRTEEQLRWLVPNFAWHVKTRKTVNYMVEAEFYRQRLGHPNPRSHEESIVIYELENSTC